LADREAEQEVAEPEPDLGSWLKQDRYFGPSKVDTSVTVHGYSGKSFCCTPQNSVDRPKEAVPAAWDAGAETPESGATFPREAPGSGPELSCGADSQRRTDEIRGAEGAVENTSGGGTNRPTSVLLDEAADMVDDNIEVGEARTGFRMLLNREFSAELRARAAVYNAYEAATERWLDATQP
jgi:hypothetical protein